VEAYIFYWKNMETYGTRAFSKMENTIYKWFIMENGYGRMMEQ
jgi:hypothetical protein